MGEINYVFQVVGKTPLLKDILNILIIIGIKINLQLYKKRNRYFIGTSAEIGVEGGDHIQDIEFS